MTKSIDMEDFGYDSMVELAVHKRESGVLAPLLGCHEGSRYESCEGCVAHDERGGGGLKRCTFRALMVDDQSIVDTVMRMLAA